MDEDETQVFVDKYNPRKSMSMGKVGESKIPFEVDLDTVIDEDGFWVPGDEGLLPYPI